ncbi:MAG: hypothetical protein PWP57_517, partial [Candidatus Atribacteria bacterium]|nr:hypothetical protein [Candidatus Atribacteria bacterium]
GLITTDDDNMAEIARKLRVHGAKKKYYNETVGYNSRLDEIQAAILRVKLTHINEAIEGRREAAQRYRELLKDIPGIVTPFEDHRGKHVYHQYTIRVLGGRRDELKECLTERGIGTMIYYPVPVHQLPIYREKSPTLPVAEGVANEVLSLPIWPGIGEEIQEKVVGEIGNLMEEKEGL